MIRPPCRWSPALLALLGTAAVALAAASGSVPLDGSELWAAVRGRGPALHQAVVWELRLPRALNGFAVGGLLALAGVLLQVLLRNPLADPYILGVSGGAATAALLTLMAGAGGAWVSGNAFLGALATVLAVFALARGPGPWSATRLLLTGVVLAAGWGAAIGLLLALAPDGTVRGMLFWLMGDLGRPSPPLFPWLVLALCTAAALPLGRSLNLLAAGESQAALLGVHVGALRVGVYALASLATATAVTVAGSVGFVGLVIPHLLRLACGADHRLLLPNAVLAGGAFLVAADTLARSAAAPRELPVGVLTALLGVPLFLLLLRRLGR